MPKTTTTETLGKEWCKFYYDPESEWVTNNYRDEGGRYCLVYCTVNRCIEDGMMYYWPIYKSNLNEVSP